jgi:BolA protein
MSTAEKIEKRLRERFAPTRLEITDDSAKHVGHAGAARGGGHYACLIVAEGFRGRAAVERHRAVYEALGDLMKHEVHALALTTLDPEEWSRRVG